MYDLVHYTVVVMNYTIVAIDWVMMWLFALFAWWRSLMIMRRMDDKLEELKVYFNTKFNEQEKK